MIAKSSVPHPCEPSSYLIASGVLYTILNFWGVFRNKEKYYPNLSKPELFSKGYFNKTSNHCSGSTVDLTILDPHNKALDMGTIFDFMDPLSHPDSKILSTTAQHNRAFLQQLMIAHGFEPIDTEWRHFRLIDEPFPNKRFDFDIR